MQKSSSPSLSNYTLRTSLAVQRLRLHASTAGGMGLIPSQGSSTSHGGAAKQWKHTHTYTLRVLIWWKMRVVLRQQVSKFPLQSQAYLLYEIGCHSAKGSTHFVYPQTFISDTWWGTILLNLIVFTSVQIRWLGRLGMFRSCTFQTKDWLLTSTWEGTSKPLELPACQEHLCIPGVLTMSYSLCQQYDFCWTLAFVCLGVSGLCCIGLTSRRLQLEKLKSVMWFPHAGIRSTLTDPSSPPALRLRWVSLVGNMHMSCHIIAGRITRSPYNSTGRTMDVPGFSSSLP